MSNASKKNVRKSRGKFHILGFYLSQFYDLHNYFASFLLALLITVVFIFYRSSEVYLQDNISELFEFVEIELFDTSQSASSSEEIDPNQVIASIEATAVDMSFVKGVNGPKIIGGLKRDYPKIAEKNQIEAVVLLEIIINVDGRVVKTNVIGVQIKKSLPAELKRQVKQAFARSADKMMKKARFTTPKINGREVPIKLEIPLDFFLEN